MILFDKGYISDARLNVDKEGRSLGPITFSITISDKSKSACRAACTRFSEVGTGNSGAAFALIEREGSLCSSRYASMTPKSALPVW